MHHAVAEGMNFSLLVMVAKIKLNSNDCSVLYSCVCAHYIGRSVKDDFETV